MEEQAIIAEIREFIEKNVVADGVKLAEDRPLQESGIDSFSLVEIILFIERRFALAIPEDRMLPEHFQTLRTMARLVSSLTGS
jgi:acyl carrier protein